MLLLNFVVKKLVSASLLDYAYIGSRVAQRSYGVPNTHFEPTYDNLGRVDIHRTYHPTNGDIVNFDYDYAANENNIYRKAFDHRPDDEYNEYTYDDLDRLIDLTYHDSQTEEFCMDNVGAKKVPAGLLKNPVFHSGLHAQTCLSV